MVELLVDVIFTKVLDNILLIPQLPDDKNQKWTFFAGQSDQRSSAVLCPYIFICPLAYLFLELHLILYTRLCDMPHLVKPFRGNVGTVLPEDGLVEAELDELVLVAQLLECGIREQRRKVHLAALARAERTEQSVVAQLFYICNRE